MSGKVGDQDVDSTRPTDYFPGSARIRVVRIVGNDVGALLLEKLDNRGTDVPVGVGHEDPASFESSTHRFNLAP